MSISESWVRDYVEQERERGRLIAPQLLTNEHTIKSPKALYPEYHFGESIGLHRPGVNLGALVCMFPQVIAYVPPMKRSQFRARFGIRYDDFVRLSHPDNCERRFILPVLNHPSKYRDPETRRELSEILLWRPPTWERWHEALRTTGGTAWFRDADSRFDYPAMWSLPTMRDKWAKRLGDTNEALISKEIKQQIRNNYTDLQLVGLSTRARELAQLSHMDPALSLVDLMYTSDLYAYPSIMGAGGMANVRVSLSSIPQQTTTLEGTKPIPKPMEQYDSDVLFSLLNGLKIENIPAHLRVDFLEAWHRSSEAATLRRAYHNLTLLAAQRNPSGLDFHSTVKVIVSELLEFTRSTEPSPEETQRRADRKQTIIVRIAAAGSVSSTILGIVVPDLKWMIAAGAIGIVSTMIGAKTWSDRRRIVKSLLHRHHPDIPDDLFFGFRSMNDFVVEFWRRAQTSDADSRASLESPSTTVPVRGVLWQSP